MRTGEFTDLPFARLLLSHKALEEWCKVLCALLGVALLAVAVVDVGDAKTSLVTLGPLEVVKEGPGEVATDIDTIKGGSRSHGLDIVVVVLETEVVLEDLLHGHVVLSLDAGTTLGDINLGVVVTLAQPDKQVTETGGTRPEPG